MTNTLLAEYQNFVSDWECLRKREQEFLHQNKIDLVVSDISPLPFEAADSLGIPSVGVSNFTWYTAYEGLIEDHDLKTYKEAYQKMTAFFSLAGSHEHWSMQTEGYGFFSREVDEAEVKRIREQVNPNGDRKVIFLGLGMKINVDTLEQLPIWDSPNCVFLVSSNVQVHRENVFQIPSNYLESQNYIAASDLVISKAGWGMVGEALTANVPLLIIDRPSMKEDQNTIHYLRQKRLYETIGWEEFLTYQVDPKMMKPTEGVAYNHQNEAERIAKELVDLIR